MVFIEDVFGDDFGVRKYNGGMVCFCKRVDVMFNKVLIVNCGVIVICIICIFKDLDVISVVIYVDVDIEF